MSQPKITIDPSFRRKPESSAFNWTPAFAGVTATIVQPQPSGDGLSEMSQPKITIDPSFRRRPESSAFKETLNKSFDRLRTNGKLLISFVVSLSNHKANQLVSSHLNWTPACAGVTTNDPSFRRKPESSVFKETLNKSFDRLRTNGTWLISFVVSLSNHKANQLVSSHLNWTPAFAGVTTNDPSFRRRPESSVLNWTPAFAGVTATVFRPDNRTHTE
jgi:hypothetical protein